MKINKTTSFLIAYFAFLGAFSFAGYYLYADYSMRVTRQHSAKTTESQASDLTYIDLPRISITLASIRTDHSGNVRMDITLEVEARYAAHIEGERPRITDRLVSYTQTLDYDELSRPKATLWLRPDLLKEVNTASAPYPIKDIIFRQFVVL